MLLMQCLRFAVGVAKVQNKLDPYAIIQNIVFGFAVLAWLKFVYTDRESVGNLERNICAIWVECDSILSPANFEYSTHTHIE